MKKRFCILFIVISILFVILAGCGESNVGAQNETSKGDQPNVSETGEKIEIGVCINAFDDTWVQYMINAMEKHVEGTNIELVMVDGKEDAATQLAQVENFVTKKMDAIIIIPIDTSIVSEMTNKVMAANIPLLYLNRYPGDLPENVYYVGSDEYEAGKIQGEFLSGKLNKGDKVAILMGRLGEEATFKRTEAVSEAIRELGGEIVAELPANWQRAEGMRITEDWILQYGSELKAIVSNNDDAALGAIEALEAAGMVDDVIVLGIDATPDALEYLKEGKLDGTVFQNAVGQGEAVVDAAVSLVKGEKIEKEIWIPFEMVTAETADEYAAKY